MSRHTEDRVDRRRAQWARELPDVDTGPMGVLGRMRVITAAARKPIEQVFASRGLDAGEFDVVATLLRNGSPYEMRPTELFRSLMISSGGLTDRLARLEKRGLIERRASAGDARSLLVSLTQEGRQTAEQAFREDMIVEATLLSTLSPAELEQLETLLRKLASDLETRP